MKPIIFLMVYNQNQGETRCYTENFRLLSTILFPLQCTGMFGMQWWYLIAFLFTLFKLKSFINFVRNIIPILLTTTILQPHKLFKLAMCQITNGTEAMQLGTSSKSIYNRPIFTYSVSWEGYGIFKLKILIVWKIFLNQNCFNNVVLL